MRYSYFLLFFIIIFLPAGARADTGVFDIRFGVHPGKIRAVIDLEQQTPYRVFTLPNPYRVVIDLPKTRWQVSEKNLGSQNLIKDLRHHIWENGHTRLVFDAIAPIEILDTFFLPPISSSTHRLVIDFKSTSPASFDLTRKKIFGDPSFGPAETRPDLSFTSLVLTPPSLQNRTPPATTPNIPGMPGRKPAPPGHSGVPPQKPIVQKKIIIIDPGHGGIDPGAIAYNRTYEKHVTLAVAKKLKHVLESSGAYRVVLTRETDSYLKLHQRVAKGRSANGDLFVSLHADTIHKPDVRGTSVYTLSEKASDNLTAMLAEQENKADLIGGVDLTHEHQDVANILIDLATRETMNESNRFANILVKTLQQSNIRLLPNTHRYAGFAVLKAPDIPSVLIELGFLSSRKEADLLMSSEYQTRLATTIAQGINAYFSQLNRLERF